MTQLQFTPIHANAQRFGHGAKVTYHFRNGFNETSFSCTYNSVKYDSPLSQIQAENMAYFQNHPRAVLIGGTISKIKKHAKSAVPSIACEG